MKTTTVQILPTTTYGTPSGNYDGSSLDWAGVPVKAADYYGGFGHLQTLAFYLTNFVGLIQVEASLDDNPTQDSQWFRVYEFNSIASPTTNNFSTNITGNFTWMRARVEMFTQGSITKLAMSY